LWAAGALAWAAGSVAMADQPVPAGDPGRTGEPGYFQPGYYANGKFHQLLVSPNELAVELADPQERASAATRARTGGIGVLEAVPWGARDGKFAILRVLDEATAARARVRELPEFVSVNPVYRHAADGPPILSSGRIVVKLVAGLTPADQEELFESYRVDWGRPVPGLANVHLVAPRGQADNLELVTAAALYRDPRTVYAHPDLRLPVEKRQFVGVDTFADQQWYLENTGQNGGTPGADIDIFNAFRRTSGAGVLFGQLDDSCDVDHEDLAANYLGISHDTVDNTQSATAAAPRNEGDRHGTPAMGLMCAEDDNGVGISGIAPDAQFTASRGLEAFVTPSQIASAYTFARNRSVDVHNNSWGFGAGTPNPDVLVDAIRTAYNEGRDGRGMVICFAAGSGLGMDADDPAAEEVSGDDELATLPTVIGVGASDANDRVAGYSNFGPEIDLVAPSNGTNENLPAIVTTDNTDATIPIEPGFNANGFSDDGQPNLADPNYTNNFGGTSASAAMVSGTAGLILSLEPNYTAQMVRNIIEHTCDQIATDQVSYNAITSRNLRYGYGRLNAGNAVEATFDGFFWPERVADVVVDTTENTIRWKINDDLREFGAQTLGVPAQSVLVVESDDPFSWAPTDGEVYSVGQEVASGVTVVANLLAEVYAYNNPNPTKYFGIYTVALTQRRGLTYGFGVSANSDGDVLDSGVTLEDSSTTAPPGRPSVTINVTPLSGESPLLVSFEGNAQSSAEISGYEWDFGDGSTSNDRITTHTYNVGAGTQRFFATLTVTDVNGAVGGAAVGIDVSAPGTGDGNGGGPSGSVNIRISDPTSPDSDISSGFAPLSVVLNAEVEGIGSPTDLTVFWDLGDGNTASSLSVAHIYQIPGRFPVSVTVSSSTLSADLRSTRFIDVFTTATPTPTPTATPDPGNGTDGTGCGVGAMAAMWSLTFAWAALVGMRRRTRA
jgi:PKD repeat protein